MNYRRTIPRSNQPAQRGGFTLVELSIVLVIIGLLIGGILSAQSLVENAKQNALIQYISQLDLITSNFESKYNSLPGDSTFFANPGDGDGRIEDYVSQGSHANTQQFNYEVGNFWVHLQKGGLTPETWPTFTNVATTGIRPLVNVPQFERDKTIQPMLYHAFNNVANTNYYMLCDYNRTTTQNIYGGVRPASSFTPYQAFALDKKIDDGIGSFLDLYNGVEPPGKVLAYKYTDASTSINRDGTATSGGKCVDAGEQQYKSSVRNSYECCLLIKLQRETK